MTSIEPHRFLIPNARPNETLAFLLRRHWMMIVRRIILYVLAFLVPFILFVMFRDALLPPLADRTSGGVVLVMGASLYYVFLGVYAFHAWLDYSLDVWVVTNERILNIEQHGLFSRVTAELPLDAIQDVTVEVHGALPTLLQYGDVHIQTAAETPRFLFDDVSKPAEVASAILELHDRRKKG